MPSTTDPRPLMVEIAHLLYSRFLTNSAGGNVSCRVGERIYFMPQGVVMNEGTGICRREQVEGLVLRVRVERNVKRETSSAGWTTLLHGWRMSVTGPSLCMAGGGGSSLSETTASGEQAENDTGLLRLVADAIQ
jgi:hypothetical protein